MPKDYLPALNGFVKEHSLETFYPKDCQALQNLAHQADVLIQRIHPRPVLHAEVAKDMLFLSLYKIVLLLGSTHADRIFSSRAILL